MKVTLYGTRGSLPSPGEGTNRFGGNTACVRVDNDDGQVLILDAGSGIAPAGRDLPAGTRRVDVLLTHLHLDHIQGLGFFRPLFTPGMEVHIWGPPSTTRTLRKRLARYLSPPLFPVRIAEVPATVTCHDTWDDTWEIGGYRIGAHLVSHPGPTVGFRIACEGKTLAYLPDHEPQLGRRTLPHKEWLSGFSVGEGADLLIHDAQYTPEEYDARVGWGHCTPPLAARFAEEVAAKKLLFFHHDPDRNDDELEALCDEAARGHTGDIEMSAAAELDVFEL